ncbi:MAG: hypothetical protein KH972_02610 [Peptostreptococcaceae bacterium]|nr:hypothetical protein [Peptostreptococcaceae bacterium]
MADLKELLGEKYKEGMTVEEIEVALKEVTLPKDNTLEYEKLKSAFDKASSEAADYKKQLRAKLSEDEQAKQKDQEERAELQQKYEKLLYETEVSKNKAKFLGLGYDEKLAEETAEALQKGDMEKVFSNQKKFQQDYEKKIRTEVLKDTPKPEGDGGSKTITLNDLRAMSSAERYNYSVEHPEEYKQLYGGNE